MVRFQSVVFKELSTLVNLLRDMSLDCLETLTIDCLQIVSRLYIETFFRLTFTPIFEFLVEYQLGYHGGHYIVRGKYMASDSNRRTH